MFILFILILFFSQGAALNSSRRPRRSLLHHSLQHKTENKNSFQIFCFKLEQVETSSALCRKRFLNHAEAVSAVGNMQSVISTVNNENKKLICREIKEKKNKTLPVDTEPRVGAIHVPSDGVLLRELTRKKILTCCVAYQPIDDNVFN